MKNLILFALIVPLFATLKVGEVPPMITLAGNAGGRVDGSLWSSDELKGKVWVVVYADPDESELNNAATEAMKAKDFDLDYYGSVAVVNYAATWKPNFAISMILKGKQEDYPNTIYVKDIKKSLVKNWNLKDDSNDIVVVAPNGKVVFSVDGQLNDEQIDEMIGIIEAHITALKAEKTDKN